MVAPPIPLLLLLLSMFVMVTPVFADVGPKTDSDREARSIAMPFLYVSLSALQVYDVYSTASALRMGGVEVNPIVHHVAGRPAAFMAVKVVVTGVSIYAAERLWKDGRRAHAIALMLASNGLMAFVAQRNASVLRAMH